MRRRCWSLLTWNYLLLCFGPEPISTETWEFPLLTLQTSVKSWFHSHWLLISSSSSIVIVLTFIRIPISSFSSFHFCRGSSFLSSSVVMFGLVTGVYQTYFGSPELHILLVGAEESGKTALLERLKVTQFSKHAPPTPQTPQRTTTTTTPKSTSRTINRTLVSEFQSSTMTTTTPVTTPATTTKMTSNHRAATTNGTSTSISTSSVATPTTTTTTTNKFLSLACPAPSRYANAKEEQEEDDDDEEEEEHENTPINTPIHINNQLIRQKLAWLHEKQTSSLESVMNGDETNVFQDNHPRTPFSSPTQQTPTFMENSNNPNNTPQYHLKTGRKMLPLEKIRPTSGQNLAKLDICGAKCVILDVSGKFQDLWERYYADADAVIFCWRLDHPPQHALLEKVRHKISDDVPFLIFGHEFDLTTATKQSSQLPQHESNFTSTFSSPTTLPTEWFLPHYHSNLMMAFCGSAHNGAGVRDAIEWLIPLAKRQAKLRVTIPVPEDM